MKRAFPQELNSVPFSEISDDPMTEQPKQALPEANRRVRTSAAMIGLAISMGSYSLLAPQQGDAAVAAEPIATEPIATEPTTAVAPTVSAAPARSDVAILSPVTEPTPVVVPSVVVPSTAQPQSAGHAVQEGQTLWKIAELYGVSVTQLASTNDLPPNSVLYVGQVLQIPAGQPAAAAEPAAKQPELDSVTATVPVAPVAVIASSQLGTYTPTDESQQLLKDRQDVAVQNLKQQRDRLKQSLAELKSEESDRELQTSVEEQPSGEKSSLISYRVSSGETLSSIAQAHSIPYSELAKINQLSDPNLLRADQFIKVPQTRLASTQAVVALPSKVASLSSDNAVESVTVPVVPSLSTVTSAVSDSVITPVAVVPDSAVAGVGGEAQQVALANPAGGTSSRRFNGTQVPQSNSEKPDQYVNTLVSEIVKLREKYQSKPSAMRSKPLFSGRTQVSSMPSLGASRRVNPEFRPNRNLEALQAELRSLQRGRNSESKPQTKMDALVADAPKRKPQLVAAAPAGSESYAPLVQSSVGKMVSPSLPPLGKPDAYLPSSAGKFTGYIWPAKGILTSGYGRRWGRMHKGIDVAAPIGTPIVAAAPGKVITAGWNDGGYGNLVEIKHVNGSVTLYAHNNRILVKVGQQVTQGQQIAEMGSTGFSTGPHSHFEVHLPGQGAVNPVAYLPQERG